MATKGNCVIKSFSIAPRATKATLTWPKTSNNNNNNKSSRDSLENFRPGLLSAFLFASSPGEAWQGKPSPQTWPIYAATVLGAGCYCFCFLPYLLVMAKSKAYAKKY